MKKSLTDLIVELCTHKVSKRELMSSPKNLKQEYAINDEKLAVLFSGNSTDLSLLLDPIHQDDVQASLSRK